MTSEAFLANLEIVGDTEFKLSKLRLSKAKIS